MDVRAAIRVMEYTYKRRESVPGSTVVEDGKKKAPKITDPYRPAVGATPLDDTQLIVKSCHKLPTGSGD